jgi:hypothetical protein
LCYTLSNKAVSEDTHHGAKVNHQSKLMVSVKEYPVGLYLYKLVDGVNTISKGKFNVIK